MTKIKLCGLSRPQDIETANKLRPDYVGFVFAPKSRRYVPPERAAKLKRLLDPGILAVGVFVREEPLVIRKILEAGIIDVIQLHGGENREDIRRLREFTDKPIIQAFRIDGQQDIVRARESRGDFILLDSGNGGTGTAFDWKLAGKIGRPYFLAGGLEADNVASAVRTLHPYGVDVSSGIETDGVKDESKMAAFVAAVRKEERI